MLPTELGKFVRLRAVVNMLMISLMRTQRKGANDAIDYGVCETTALGLEACHSC